MTSLRERQKTDRRMRIIAAAKDLIADAGLDKITIEAIADLAGVSSVTVHNYYGTKSGVLLALVAESDRELLDTMQRDLVGKSGSVNELMLGFLSIICRHAQTNLEKAIWRQVIAASVSDADPRFGKVYGDLDDRLVQVLTKELIGLQAADKLRHESDPAHLAKALFNLQNARFIQFIASDDINEDHVLLSMKNDLAALFPSGVV